MAKDDNDGDHRNGEHQEDEEAGKPRPGQDKAFFFGPFFKVIPAQRHHYERTSSNRKKKVKTAKAILNNSQYVGTGQDYLDAIKKLILNRQDTDETYGLKNDELVPLPFDAPPAWEYVVDFLSGTYLVAQATVVMFIAILVDNDQRGIVLGDSYSRSFLPLIKALIILYPLVTLVVMTLLTCEYLFRKFMYYRLLSLRVLVDWENRPFWKGWFFYYFIATWVLLNVWSIWGVVQFWDRGARSGADTVPFATFIVVNLQTIQLFLYYYRLMTSEQRLVSLNMIFERAPIEAQMLLTYTYVVEEYVLISECLDFGANAMRSLEKRVLNLLSCGLACKDWAQKAGHARFELDNLKGGSDNFEAVEENVSKLRDEINRLAEEEEARRSSHRTTPVKSSGASPYPTINTPQSAPSQTSPSMSGPAPSPPSYYPSIPSASVVQPLSASTSQPPGLTGSANPLYPSIGVVNGGSVILTANDFGVTSPPTQPPMEKRPCAAQGLPAGRNIPIRHRRKSFEGNWFERKERAVQMWMYKKFYGTIHGVFTSILVHFPTWPFRGDVPYFRMMLILEVIGLLSVAAIVVFGVLRATNTDKCLSVNKTCAQCSDAVGLLNSTCTINWNIMQRTRRLEL